MQYNDATLRSIMFRMPEIIPAKQGRGHTKNKFVHTDKCPIRVKSLQEWSLMIFFFKRNGSKRHTVNARCKQTAQLTAKRLTSGIRIRILLTCLKFNE